MSFLNDAWNWYKENASPVAVWSKVGDVAGQAWDDLTGKSSDERQMELAKYQYSMDLKQWERENEYNTPASQVQRMIEAGLNPYLFYSQGNPGNSSSSSPRFQAPTLEENHASGLLKAISMIKTLIGLKKGLADAGKAEAEASLKQSLVPYSDRFATADYRYKYNRSVSEMGRSAIMQNKGLQAHYDARVAQDSFQSRISSLQSIAAKQASEALYSKYRAAWMKMGITTGDNPILRGFSRVLQNLGIDPYEPNSYLKYIGGEARDRHYRLLNH